MKKILFRRTMSVVILVAFMFTNIVMTPLLTTVNAEENNVEYELDGETKSVYLSQLQEAANRDTKNQYWVVFREGYRNSRLEMSSFDAEGDFEVVWNGNLIATSQKDKVTQYYYDSSKFEQIGTYGILSDNAEEIIASNVDIYDNDNNIVFNATYQGNQGYGLGNPAINDGVTTWDCIYFGNYWQKDTNGDGKADQNDEKQPIKWRVLSVDGDDAFLLADQNLFCSTYDVGSFVGEEITWETCALRERLNSGFLSDAFSAVEQAEIRDTNVENKNNLEYGTEGGNDTVDKIYLLSIEEVSNAAYGFNSNYSEPSDTRIARDTAYAAFSGRQSFNIYEGSADYWRLRSPGKDDISAAIIKSNGAGEHCDWGYKAGLNAVRPALHLNLSSPVWKPAGKVRSDDSGTPATSIPTPTATPSVTDSQMNEVVNNISNCMPDFSNLGSAELKGPEISIGNNKLNIFKQKMNMNLSICDSSNMTVNIDEKNKTVEVLIGVKSDNKATVKKDPNDTYWRESYQEVKSLVKACGGKVNTTKLWNQFSKLRGKLKKVNGSAAFHVNGNVAGYAKLKIDDAGKVVGFEEGGITVGMDAGGSVKVPLWWIVYSEFGVSGTVDGKVFLTMDSQKTITPGGEFGLAIKPSVSLGADAVVVDIKGGIEGSIGGNVTFPWKSFQNSVSAYLTGKLYVKVDTLVPGLSGYQDWDFPKLELYPNLGKVTKQVKNLDYKRSKKVTKNQIRSVKKSSNLIASAEDSIIYENAKPAVVTLADGSVLMTYLDDTVQAAKGQTTLMYRLYQNGTWSEAKAVDQTGRLDTEAKLISHNGSVYVLYENSDVAITEDMTEEEILQHLTLKVAKFNETDKVFEKISVLQPAGAAWSYRYDFVADDSDLYAVWAENSSGNALLEEGKTKIYRSKLTEDSWSEKEELYRTNNTISDFAYGYTGKEFSLALIRDKELLVNGETIADGETGLNGVKIIDGSIYFIQDGTLMRYTEGITENLTIACSSSYEVYGDTVYWIGQDNFLSEIYMQKIGEDSVRVALTKDGGYVGGFALVKDGGDTGVIYTEQEVDSSAEQPYGVTVLKFKPNSERSQAEVTNVAYDVLSFETGQENSLAVTVANTGTGDLKNVKVIVKDSKGNILYEGAFADCITVGTQKEQTIPVTIPSDFSTSDITVEVTSDETYEEQTELSQNIEVVKTDISIAEKNKDCVTVKNNADSEARNIVLVVKDRSESGNIIYTKNVGNLSAAQEIEISVTDAWKQAVRDVVSGTKSMYLEVSQQDTEYELWNNSFVMRKQVPADITPSPTTMPTKRPMASVTPAGEIPSATPVSAISSEKPFDTISPSLSTGKTSSQTTPADILPTPSNMPNDDTVNHSSAKTFLTKATLKSVKNIKGRKLTAKWKKASNADGYQIQYAANKKFKKAKSQTVKSTSVTLKKLKKKKTYFVRVRAYKAVDGKKVYGKWSSVKKVKIKK